jgi:hypothetical protein
MSGNQMSEEEYLKQHIQELESQKQNNGASTDVFETMTNKSTNSSRVEDLQFLSFDVKDLPCGMFYPQGTLLMVRAAQVKEIQSYSMVDDNNFYDIIEKMNDMLQSCVRIKYSDGKMSSYMDLKDQDRLYVIFLIRELTFQKGNALAVNVTCTCGAENSVELKRENFAFHELDEKLLKFYSKSRGSFIFNTVNNKEFELTLPNIGIQKSFTDYIIKENQEKRQPNLAFLKIIPFMLGNRNSITNEGIKSKLSEFQSMDDISFQFLNAAVGKMTFGIKELKKQCFSCGVEIRTEMTFPNGASGLFVIHDAFETFIKK